MDPSLQSDYEVLAQLKKEQVERAKKDPEFFRELVTIKQFKSEIHCAETTDGFKKRIGKLEVTKNRFIGALKLLGIISIVLGIVTATLAIMGCFK